MKTRWIEFFIATGIFLFLFIAVSHDIKDSAKQIPFQLHAATLYGLVSLYLLYVYPRFFSTSKMFHWVIWVAFIFFTDAFGHFVIQQYYPLPPHQLMPPLAISGVLCLGILSYTAIKVAIHYLINRSNKNPILSQTLREFFVAFGVGILTLILVIQVNQDIAALTAFAIPFCYTLFATHYYYLLPYLSKEQAPKLIHIVSSILINLVCIVIFSSLMEMAVQILGAQYSSLHGFNVFFCLILALIITPTTYVLYSHQHRQQKQLIGLQKKLGQTSADLQLLQSQINPHFLFNAMNTLYGIAIHEQAERTAEGIQRLSEMMRFMLHENQQEHILLARELTYIQEYIALQKLRIADLPSIQIDINLPEDIIENQHISPMLLIPFFENAFKHGISLNKPSWIRGTLAIEEDNLKLHIHNSIHPQKENDPERHQSGIGLENVKNRLHLLYPETHNLHIEETTTEYFIFLTLKLKNQEK